MANPYFQFKKFTVYHDRCAMKVTTDACLFGAWVAGRLNGRSGSILDIGSGSGLLSLMLAQQVKGSIKAVELVESAASQAEENIAASRWRDRIETVRSDIRDYKTDERFQYIISNPPFYENELSSPYHGRKMAHHGGGLLISDLLKCAERLLDNNGYLYLLFPFKRWPELEAILRRNGWYVSFVVNVRQSANHPNFRVMIEASRKPVNQREDTVITIREGEDYSPQFINLLKPYYLYL